MEHRFSRTELLIGQAGLEKLDKSRVIVFGVGGVGSYAVEGLARAGVGSLVLVDFDDVSISNLNRQIHALETTVGTPKVDLMKERVLLINPNIKIEVFRELYTPEKGEKFIVPELDYIIDAIDNVTGKIDIITRAKLMGIPVISAMGAGNKLNPEKFEVADISQTSVCPLARVIRRELKQRGLVQGVKVVYSREQPLTPGGGNVDHALNCAPQEIEGEPGCVVKRQVPGSISFVPSVMGLIIAGVVVRDLIEV